MSDTHTVKESTMTALEACDRFEEAINDLHPETKDSNWEWNFTEDHTDEQHLDNMRDTLAKTREHFGLHETTAMWFVSTSETDATLAQCGNSPTAITRARYLSYCSPTNIKFLIERIRELKARS